MFASRDSSICSGCTTIFDLAAYAGRGPVFVESQPFLNRSEMKYQALISGAEVLIIFSYIFEASPDKQSLGLLSAGVSLWQLRCNTIIFAGKNF